MLHANTSPLVMLLCDRIRKLLDEKPAGYKFVCPSCEEELVMTVDNELEATNAHHA